MSVYLRTVASSLADKYARVFGVSRLDLYIEYRETDKGDAAYVGHRDVSRGLPIWSTGGERAGKERGR